PLLSRRHVPDMNLAVARAQRHRLAIRREGEWPAGGAKTPSQSQPQFPLFEIPDTQLGVIGPGEQCFPVGSEGYAAAPANIRLQLALLFAGGDIPQEDPLAGGGSQLSAIWRESKGADAIVLRVDKLSKELPAGSVPELYQTLCFLPNHCGQRSAIR